MRMFVLCIAIILTATLFSLANSENTSQLGFQNAYTTGNFQAINRIFYKDNATNVVLIDFKAIQAPLTSIQVTQHNKVVLTDLVTDLSNNIIYEIDLKKYGKGDFTITLTTSQHRTITEHFAVN